MTSNLSITKKLIANNAAVRVIFGSLIGATIATVLNHNNESRTPKSIDLQLTLDEVTQLIAGRGGRIEYETHIGVVNVWLTEVEPDLETETPVSDLA